MKKIFAFAVLALAGLMPGTAQADKYCFTSGLVILGEPWLAHRQCVACPSPDGECPRPGDLVPPLPELPDTGIVRVWVTID